MRDFMARPLDIDQSEIADIRYCSSFLEIEIAIF